jgi:hypothetical protein
MTNPITYSLKARDKNSDQFYIHLSDFTDTVIQAGEQHLGRLVTGFEDTHPVENTHPELIFDLLVLGILWQIYAPDALAQSATRQRILSVLANLRRSARWARPVVDPLRGLLSRDLIKPRSSAQIPLTLPHIDKLAALMEATGDFKEEARRIRIWQAHFRSGRKPDLTSITAFADWFINASLEAFGKYTPNVDVFLTQTHPAYRGREDYIFTGRQRVEYHLYLVGAEIMNRANRERFLASEKKIIFVPPCMASPSDGHCQAKDTPLGARCESCTPSCQVHQVTKLGEKIGADVFMIPDSFSPLSSGGSEVGETSVGVIGVSCPLTITGGGWEMRRLGVPAQGLLLDHCGCSWHWDLGRGITTEINFNQLLKILDE